MSKNTLIVNLDNSCMNYEHLKVVTYFASNADTKLLQVASALLKLLTATL